MYIIYIYKGQADRAEYYYDSVVSNYAIFHHGHHRPMCIISDRSSYLTLFILHVHYEVLRYTAT